MYRFAFCLSKVLHNISGTKEARALVSMALVKSAYL